MATQSIPHQLCPSRLSTCPPTIKITLHQKYLQQSHQSTKMSIQHHFRHPHNTINKQRHFPSHKRIRIYYPLRQTSLQLSKEDKTNIEPIHHIIRQFLNFHVPNQNISLRTSHPRQYIIRYLLHNQIYR